MSTWRRRPARSGRAAPGDRYPQLLRTPQHRWWRPLLGLLLGVVTVVDRRRPVILFALAVEAIRGNAADPRDDCVAQRRTPRSGCWPTTSSSRP